jgi:phosphoribosylanthranilate isomerase
MTQSASQPLWIKICGMTSEAAVAAALEADVDAIGFVFAPSVRRIEPARAAQLAAPARGRVACIAVTRHPDDALLAEILSVFRPDALQSDVGDFARWYSRHGDASAPCELLPVLRAGTPLPAPLPARVLFEGPHSGTGTTADWDGAAQLARRTRLVLAGGLTPDNVAQAIDRVAPWGVDVSSGVESAPGVKSRARILAFVEAARAAVENRS